MPPKTERFEVRLETSVLERIDHWASRQPDRPNRSDAVRHLVERGLETKISDGDRLTIMMLRDIQKALKMKNCEIDADFIAEAIWGGHYWALDWQYPGLFHNHFDSREELHQVVDILDMWSFIEEGYETLNAEGAAKVEREAEPFGKHVKFAGFDGNYEANHMNIARFLVEHMGRFSRFKGRDLNSHYPTTVAYGRMFNVFEPIRKTLIGRRLSAGEIISILKAERMKVESFRIENESEADEYLTSLLERPEYRSVDEVILRAQKYIQDERLKKYFIAKAKAILQAGA